MTITFEPFLDLVEYVINDHLWKQNRTSHLLSPRFNSFLLRN